MHSELPEDFTEQMLPLHTFQTCKHIFSHCHRHYSLSYVVHRFMWQSFSSGGGAIWCQRLSHVRWFHPATTDSLQGTAESLSQDAGASAKTVKKEWKMPYRQKRGRRKKNPKNTKNNPADKIPRSEEEEKEVLHGTGVGIAFSLWKDPHRSRWKVWGGRSGKDLFWADQSLCTPCGGGRGDWCEGLKLSLGKVEETCCFNVCLFVTTYLN